MGKFANSLGVLTLNVDGVYTELTPKMGDKRRLLTLAAESEKKGNVFIMEEMYKFLCELFIREHPEEPKAEIEMYIETNLEKLIQEILIAFRLTTKEKLEEKTKELKEKN